MSRPTLEVADIVRAAGNSFFQQQQSHLAWPHMRATVMLIVARCFLTPPPGSSRWTDGCTLQ
jgi:hypothetical protein